MSTVMEWRPNCGRHCHSSRASESSMERGQEAAISCRWSGRNPQTKSGTWTRTAARGEHIRCSETRSQGVGELGADLPQCPGYQNSLIVHRCPVKRCLLEASAPVALRSYSQLFLEVFAKKVPRTWVTRVLLHFGQRACLEPCSVIRSTRSNFLPHLPHRYSYIGMNLLHQ